ncbi:MAG: hypothetical protein ACP5NS_00295 [Candidatus Pacearchaeota archaeon]
MTDNPLRNFTVKFFSELGAKISEDGESLVISGVPTKFQKFYGKNEPYTIAFDNSKSSLSVEIVTSESYLLKTMRSYLENTGESVLQKLVYSLQADSLIKSKLLLRNCSISKINNNLSYKPIIKFTFQTTYKYLNDEERLVNDIFVDKDSSISLDFGKFRIDSLKNKEFDIPNLRDNYELAKNKVKDLILPRTTELANELESTMSKELQRINDYHIQQVKEVDVQIAKAKSKNMATDLTVYDAQKKQFISERDLQLANEEKKYALRINTKLLTTAVILSPVYDFEVFFKNGDTIRLILLSYDPLYDKFSQPSCDLCKKQISEIILCNGNHLVCRDCGAECEDCAKISCVQCMKNKCAITHRNICKECGAVCSKCKMFKNKRFMIKDPLGRYTICRNCG